jgi:hypothetical protein
MPERIVVIEFPDAETARRWYLSDEYQAALKVRLSTSQGRVFLIDGVEPSLRPAWRAHERTESILNSPYSLRAAPSRDQ